MSREHKYRLIREGVIVGYEKWYPGERHNPESGMKGWAAHPCWLYSVTGNHWTPDYIFHESKDEFMGKLDKNGKGKECYESDLMQLTHDNIDDCCLTRIVMSEKGQWSLEYEGRIICSLYDGIYQHNGEVVRNIHNIPEKESSHE